MSIGAITGRIPFDRQLSVESLRERIGALVARQQQLRSSSASRVALEQNRLALAETQRELGHALIERHLPPFASR